MLSEIKVIFWFAWKEFFSIFYCKKCKNSWDFPRLIILLSLTMFLSLFSVATKQGLLDNFAEVLLGKIPNAGIPIWVNSNVGKSLINEEIITTLSLKNLNLHPYLEVEENHLRLPSCSEEHNTLFSDSPSCSLWRSNDKKTPIFHGISVFKADPLWLFSSKKSSHNKAKIVLSLSKFKQHFDFLAYKKVLKGLLPPKLYENIPTRADFLSIEYTGDIWLSIGSSSRHRQLTKFSVNWVDRIPAPKDYSFLFPMEIYQSLHFSEKAKLGSENFLLFYYPDGNNEKYIAEVQILSENIQKNRNIDQLNHCLQKSNSKNSNNKYRMNNKVSIDDLLYFNELNPEKPLYWIKSCLAEAEIAICDNNSNENCANLKEVFHSTADYKKSKNGTYLLSINNRGEINRYKLFDKIKGYYHGFLYVENSKDLISTITYIKNMQGKPFYFNETYENALNRFNTLHDILSVLSQSYSIIILCFIFLLLLIQLLILVGHRNNNYRIYIIKGMSFQKINVILTIQIFFASIISILLSALLMNSASLIVHHYLSPIIKKHSHVLVDTNIDLLPLSFSNYIEVLSYSFIVGSIICYFLLKLSIKEKH